MRQDRARWLRSGVPVGAVLACTALAVPLSAAASAPAAGPGVSVVVRGAGSGCMNVVKRTVAELGGSVTHQLGILNGVSGVVPRRYVAELAASDCVAAVTPDGTLQLDSIGGYDPAKDAGSLFATEQMIGAQQMWQHGYTGNGVGVAVIDTGVAPVQGLNAPNQVYNGPDLSFDSQVPQLTDNDEYGHGTHMAGIIAGNDEFGQGASKTYAGDTSHFLGVAPDAHIISVKVGDENGVVDVSQVLAAIDWVVQHQNDNGLNIRVLNLSFGTPSTQSYVLDPLAYAAEQAWHQGLVVVVSAGNSGSSLGQLNDPADDPYVIAVGAADTNGTVSTADDTVASFSSVGDGTRNPDLVAPGVHIASLGDPGSVIDEDYGSTADVAPRFFRGSGTSQATAVVSGAAALLLSESPKATPDEVKYALTQSAQPLKGQPATAQGHGELNLTRLQQMLQHLGITPNGPVAPAAAAAATQAFVPSTGLGSLDAARGGMDVVSNGVALTGDQDIFGNTFNSMGTAAAEAQGASWSGGTWNGASWSGASWSGASWSGASWSGASWSGASWSGASWSGASWSGASWSGASWSGASWSGASWSGASWSGASWSGASWSGALWSGDGWADASWS